MAGRRAPTEDVRGKVAPEDSTFWKCNWIHCVNGCGLSGHGVCSARGEWNNPNCPQFEQTACEHGIFTVFECAKCTRKNTEIMDRTFTCDKCGDKFKRKPIPAVVIAGGERYDVSLHVERKAYKERPMTGRDFCRMCLRKILRLSMDFLD